MSTPDTFLDSFLALGTEIDLAEQDGAYGVIKVPMDLCDLTPILLVKIVNTDKGKTYHQILHNSRDMLEDINPLVANDLLYYLYKHKLYTVYNEIKNKQPDETKLPFVEVIEENKVKVILRDLYKHDRHIIESCLHDLKSISKYTKVYKNGTVI